MKMISDETSLKHYGIPGMKWGQRRSVAQTARTLDKAAEGFTKSGNKSKFMAKETAAYVSNHTNTKNKTSPTGGPIRSLGVKLNQKASKAYAEDAKRNSNMSKGIKKAQSLVKGMPMKDAIATLEKAAGYSKGVKATNALFLSKDMRLTLAATDYAMQQTKMGEREV